MKRKLLLAAVTLFAAVFSGGNALKAANDITSNYLTNANLGTKETGWTCAKYTDWQIATNASTNVNVVEFWAGSGYTDNKFSISQTITLPAGYYRLAVNAFYRNGWSGDGTNSNNAWIFAGSKTQNVIALNNGDLNSYAAGGIGGSGDLQKASNAFKLGNFSNEFDFSLDKETTIEVGFAGQNFTGGSWCIFGPVKIYEYTVDDYLADYRTKVAEAEALYDSPMNATVLSELKAAVVDESTLQTVDDVTNAIQALNVKINAANVNIGYYIKIKNVIDANALYVATFDTDGQNAYATASAEAIDAYDNGTATDGSAQITALDNALVIGCKAQTQFGAGAYMTGFIVNPSFENDFNGWTNKDMVRQSNTSFGKTGTWYVEAWEPDGTKSISQSVTLPIGYYRLSAKTKARGVTSAKLYANNTEETITVSDDINNTIVDFTCIGDVITIGFEGVGTKAGSSWLCVDDFQLTYQGQLNDEDAEAVYNTAIAKAQAITQETIPTAAYNTLQDVITANTLSSGTATEYSNAATALNAAVADATPLKEPYTAWKVLKAYADDLVAVSNNNETANETFANAISAQNTVAEAATTVAALTTATSSLKTAMVTYVNAAQPTNNEFFDLTGLIVNPHFKEGTATNPTGWTANWPNRTDNAWAGAHELRIATHNFEAYHKAFELSQTIEGLPKGTYKVTLQGFARHDGADTDKTNLFCGMMNQPFMNITDEYSTTKLTEGKPALGDNNGESSRTIGDQTVYQPNGMSGSYYYFQETNPATHQPFYTNEVETLITEAGDLKIGFKCDTWSDWVIWDNFHLYYYGSAIAVTIDENVSKTFSENVEEANVTLNRTIKAGLNTLVLPFDMTQEEVVANFGEGSKVYVVSAYEDATSTMTLATQTDGIKANVPCILDATRKGLAEDKNVFELSNRTLKAGTPTASYGNLSFIGSYAAETTIAKSENNYVLSGGQLYYVDTDGGVTMKGTRAYFQVAGSANSRDLSFVIDDGEATEIAEIDEEPVEDGVIYNLAGQVVGPDYKGIAIINGKKVLLK